jgi:hypothetical protein
MTDQFILAHPVIIFSGWFLLSNHFYFVDALTNFSIYTTILKPTKQSGDFRWTVASQRRTATTYDTCLWFSTLIYFAKCGCCKFRLQRSPRFLLFCVQIDELLPSFLEFYVWTKGLIVRDAGNAFNSVFTTTFHLLLRDFHTYNLE